MEFFTNSKILIPTNKEIFLAIRNAENEEELTDREIWILSEFGEFE